MSDVVFTALGGKKNKPKPVQTTEQAVAAFSAVFGGKGKVVKGSG